MSGYRYTPSVQELRAFVLCARLGSASRAAGALNLTQSAVSRSIRTLEDRLGVTLFQRIRQRLVLSDAGRAMLRDADQILASLDRSTQMIMAFGGSRQVLRLAVLPTFAAMWLIPRLGDFAARHPGVSLDLTSALLPVDFDDSPFDAAIQRAEMARTGAVAMPIMSEKLIVVAAPHLHVTGDLTGVPLIQQATRPHLWADWLAAAGLSVEAIRGPRFEHFEMVIAAARAGLGAAVLPDIFAQSDLRRGTLVQASPTALPGASPYALIHPAREPGGTLAAFAEWLRSQVGRAGLVEA
ncbi:LysR substrate-binding domain-containing protein [Paracoccus luteus]|uniref:LysR substrate-binding domain-containing protein n=1 Tax=Paracoccus luteus TaxID=2508543 RepID=UPI00107024CE|nr:LysR substrate-binding domain-containing protein [Paracoccus luteus]